MQFVDVHAHLDYPDFDNCLADVIKRAEQADVKYIVSAGVNPESNRKTLEIAKRFNTVKPALGIYPPDALAKEINAPNPVNLDSELEFIEKNKNKIIAISEIGLDYHNGKDKELQKEFFSKQLELAKSLNKPVVVHSCKAEEDVLNILEACGYQKVVLHCFCGKKSLLKRAIELDYHFSIPTHVVRAENIQMIVKEVNINKLLTETDSPFLSPFKDKKNEPAFVIESVKKIAEIKGFELKETADSLFLNFERLFL